MSKEEVKKKEHLSYSAISNFETCQRGYWEEFVGKYKNESDARALLVGQFFHACIEALGYQPDIDEWLSYHEFKHKFFQKSKKDTMYSDFIVARQAAQDLIDMGLYQALDQEYRLHYFDEFLELDDEEAENRWEEEHKSDYTYEQEVRLKGVINKVPFVGVVDLLEINDKNIIIRDWKYIKDFKRVYNEKARSYEEWYEKYIPQQLAYVKLLIDERPELRGRSINIEIVGVCKGGDMTVKQIQFGFKDLGEMFETATWRIFSSNVKYAWEVLNETTNKTKEQLGCCGTCSWCRENHVVLSEKIDIE